MIDLVEFVFLFIHSFIQYFHLEIVLGKFNFYFGIRTLLMACARVLSGCAVAQRATK